MSARTDSWLDRWLEDDPSLWWRILWDIQMVLLIAAIPLFIFAARPALVMEEQ